MSTKPSYLELKVGLFVLIGFVVIAAMAIQFGRMGQALKQFYTLTVRLPNAGGIIKGSDVLLAGARIGFVAEKPEIDANLNAVTVNVKIEENIKLPKALEFSVGSSGLLGDRFIQVNAAKFDLRLMSIDSTDDLPQEGQVRSLVIVAVVKGDLHIRIFNSNGKIIADKRAKDLANAETEAALKKLKELLSQKEKKKKEIINSAASIAGLTEVWKDGDVVKGLEAGGGISELTSKGGVVMDDFRKSLAKVQEAVSSIQKGVLNEENFKNLQQTFANLKATSENFVNVSHKIDSVVQDAGKLVESGTKTMNDAGQTMATANYAAEDIRKAIEDARKAIKTAQNVIASAQGAMNEITRGDGIIADLLTSQKLADDLEALVSNLRQHGVLFYRDTSGPGETTARPPLRKKKPLITGGRGH